MIAHRGTVYTHIFTNFIFRKNVYRPFSKEGLFLPLDICFQKIYINMYTDHFQLKAYFYFYIFVFRKFICLNDNIDHTQDQAKTVSKFL